MFRNINQSGLDMIKSFEGLRLRAYPDPGTGGKPWTVGYGHTGPDVHPNTHITVQEAEALLKGDLDKFEAGVEKAVGANTTDNQFAAMVSLAYNIGLGAFLRSTVLRQHRAGNHKLAAAAFLMWVKGGGRTLPGLVRRRATERALYLS